MCIRDRDWAAGRITEYNFNMLSGKYQSEQAELEEKIEHVRLGASSVTCVYRRRIADMSALPDEVQGAIAEGAEIRELSAPVRILSLIHILHRNLERAGFERDPLKSCTFLLRYAEQH